MSVRAKLAWVAVLYFAEGLPYGLIFDTFNAYLSTQGVSLREVGLAASAGLPWTIKFLWAPAVDLWGERRHWFTACQVAVALALIVAASRTPNEIFAILWVLLLFIALAGATQDIAIDAYTIDLVDQKEMGPANGVRQTAYRAAIITAGGLLIWLADWSGWPSAFLTAAAMLLMLAVISIFVPKIPPPRDKRDAKEPIARRFEGAVVAPFRLFLARRGILSFFGVLAFVLCFRVGEYALGPMVNPFRIHRGLSLKEVGFMVGVLSPACTVAGALLAGWLTTRLGIFRALWFLGLFQGASNLAYSAAALSPAGLKWPLYAASAVESFCSGLGSTPFMAFLMVICVKGHAATQFALLTALFNVTGLIARSSSGFLTEWLGFASYFTATFALSFVSYLFLPWVRRWVPQEKGR
jgi:PAT family beta-lactamase induction signal transducer AmpG